MGRHSLNDIEYTDVPEHYLQQRSLKRGSSGWGLLASLGVSLAISGNFVGWNVGITAGGFGGFLIAVIAMAVLYICMALSLAELSAALPTAGGGYSYARRALGPWGGYLTGTAILLEYLAAPAIIAIFMSDCIFLLTGNGNALRIYAVLYAVSVGLHCLGAGKAFKLTMILTAFAVLTILLCNLALIPHFNWERLFDIVPNIDALGHSLWLPEGWIGICAAVPFAIWLFLAVEAVPLASEESREPSKNLPKGLIAAVMVLITCAGLVSLLSAGTLGSNALKQAAMPLVQATAAIYSETSWLSTCTNAIGLVGLAASFLSIIYACSRQIFALSRAGYLPKCLSVTSRRNTPNSALIVLGILGFILSLSGQADLLIIAAVFGATLSYILMMASHIRLRQCAPDLARPYKTPGGMMTSGTALLLSCLAFTSLFIIDLEGVLLASTTYLMLAVYFGLYSRFRLVAEAPEEAFATILQTEKNLDFYDQKAS